MFYSNGPDRLIRRLAGYLALAMNRGELRKANSRLAATQFLAVIVGDLQLRLAMGLAPPSRAERRNVVKAGVEMFIRPTDPTGIDRRGLAVASNGRPSPARWTVRSVSAKVGRWLL